LVDKVSEKEKPVPLITPLEGGPPSSLAMQTLHWASCHLGILFLGSLALAALLVKPRPSEAVATKRRLETEAGLLEGDGPLFI
jgi:hypothetical protein